MTAPTRQVLWSTLAVVEGALIVWLTALLLTAPPAAEAATPGAAERSVPAAAPAEPADAAAATEEVAHSPAARAATDAAPTPAPTPAKTSVLHGSVTDTAGSAVDRARLTLFRGTGADAERVLRSHSGRGAGSHYALPGLTPGEYRLDATADGHRERSVSVTIPYGVPSVRRDVELETTWMLRVRIDTPDGRPLHEHIAELVQENRAVRGLDVSALATVDPPPATLPPTDSRRLRLGMGDWRTPRGFSRRSELPARYAGELELPARRPLYISAVVRNAVLATERVEAGQEEVLLTVSETELQDRLCTVRLRLVDAETRAPITDARVALNDAQTGSNGRPVDADGRFEANDLRPGYLDLEIRVADRVTRAAQVELPPGAVVDLGDIPVFEPVTTTVRVADADSDQKYHASARNLDVGSHPHLRGNSLRYGERPSPFDLRLAPGRYRIRVSTEGRLGTAEFDTAAVGDTGLTITLASTAELRVVPPGPAHTVELRLVDATGGTAFARWITWDDAFDVNLKPGTYTAITKDLGGNEHSRQVTVPASGTTLDLR